MVYATDQPLTPTGRLFIQPLTEQIVNGAIAFQKPIDVDAFRTTLENSVFLRYHRFRSLMVRDSSGREHWRKLSHIDVNDHLIVHHELLSTELNDEDAINDHIADLAVSSPLSPDKPLWEIHLFLAHNTAVTRFHHVLGDGISLMSALMSCMRKVDDLDKTPTVGGVGRAAGGERKRRWSSVWKVMKVVWYTLVYSLELVLRGLWKRDKTTVLSGGKGVELWPRKLATARFKIDDMKIVKGAVLGATINDVLFAIFSSGLSRYLDIVTPKDKFRVLREGLQLTGMAMVNLRREGGVQDVSKLVESKSGVKWGNRLGLFLLPVYYHQRGSNPIMFVKRAKEMTDKKKLSLEALFAYKIGYLVMSLFGMKLCSLFNYRVVCNTTFSVSNVFGPREEVTLGGNVVKHIRVTSSSVPHAITMHMLSYAGVADMQILVAKDIIPDPKVLAKCFEDALIEMKVAAQDATKCSKEEVRVPIDLAPNQ